MEVLWIFTDTQSETCFSVFLKTRQTPLLYFLEHQLTLLGNTDVVIDRNKGTLNKMNAFKL